MSVSIRLAKFGKRNAPSYRVVVTKTRSKRDSSFIDIIGHFNPHDPTKDFTIDDKLYKEWVGKGAIVSKAVKDLVEGRYEYKKYAPKRKKEEEKQPEDESANVENEEKAEE